VRRLVPNELELPSDGRTVDLIISAQRITLRKEYLGLSKNHIYNEVSYIVHATPPAGGWFFPCGEMHLNSKDAVDLGAKYFGYPKKLAQVSYQSSEPDISPLPPLEESNRLLFD